MGIINTLEWSLNPKEVITICLTRQHFFSRLNAPDRLQSQIKSGERGGGRTLWEKYGDQLKGRGRGRVFQGVKDGLGFEKWSVLDVYEERIKKKKKLDFYSFKLETASISYLLPAPNHASGLASLMFHLSNMDAPTQTLLLTPTHTLLCFLLLISLL